jgi:tRNA pseudouridine32 synthase/23S rRNA pseudouridine746 synthase
MLPLVPLAPLVHVDDALIAADKPADLLSVPGRGLQNADCLAVRLQSLYADALIVHRLDMATSGLIVFGRGAAVQRALSIAFAERRVAKTYVAVVDGLMNDDAGEIDLPLIADWPNRPRQMVDAVRGKPSRTRWRVLSREAETGRTRVELEPVTGRSHQLRVHLRAIGHPILGDTLYAPPAVAARSQRLLLHASRLQLAHPVDGHALDLRSALPF